MSAAFQKHYLTEQDYLTLEALSVHKNEYVDGECYAMAGAGEKYNRISGNIFIYA